MRRQKWVLPLLLLLLVVPSWSVRASVPPGFCNSHSVLKLGPLTTQGGYFSAVNINMNANWNSIDRNFVLKTMWVGTGTSDWVEIGFMDGDLNGSSYHGPYAATTYPQYSEMPIYGFSTAPGLTHNYEVQYVGSGIWRAYVDFTQVKDFTNAGYTGSGVDVGFETGSYHTPYSNFTYDSPSYSTSHQYKDYATGTWKNWSGGQPAYDNGCINSAQMPYANFGTGPDYSQGVFTHP